MKINLGIKITCCLALGFIFTLSAKVQGDEHSFVRLATSEKNPRLYYTPQAEKYIERAEEKIREKKRKEEVEKVAETKVGLLDGEAEELLMLEQMPHSVEYFIAIGDAMEIFVWQNPDLCKDVTVGPDGKISFPLVGRIRVAGLTIQQLEARVTEGLSKYIQYPQVSIIMKDFTGEKVIVLGEVALPGIYTYTGEISVFEAIALAGDFTEKARKDSVMIVRTSSRTRKHTKVMRVDINQAVTKEISKESLILRAKDVVYVPKSFIANFNKFLQNVNPTIERALDVIELRRAIRNWPER